VRPKNSLLRTPSEPRSALCLQAREKFFNFFQPVAESAFRDAHIAPRFAAQDSPGKITVALLQSAHRGIDAVLLPAAADRVANVIAPYVEAMP